MASRSMLRTFTRLPTLGSTTTAVPRQPIAQLCRRYASSSSSNEPRSAIVTGSSRGIGKSVALRLAEDGYDVCVNDVSANKAGIEEVVAAIKGMGRKAVGVEADVTDFQQVEKMVQTSVKELGPLKTMIANAGIVQVKRILDLTEADFERMFRVNLFGVQHCFKAAAQQIISQGTAQPDNPCKLIAASSIAAVRPFNLLAHYCAAKAGVVALCHNYAIELAEHHITCNNYAPGIVDTPMWGLIDQEIGRMRGDTLGKAVEKGEVLKQYSRELIALGRTSVPEDVAKAVSFMAGKDSDYITGQTMVVDGGIVWR